MNYRIVILIKPRVAIARIYGLLLNIGIQIFYQEQSTPAFTTAQMAVWRFGGGDFSWEWDLVTLGIVTSVLAALAILAICCLLANDGNGWCISFCCFLMVIFVILIGVGFGLGLRASEKPYISSSLRKSVTIYNQQC